MRSRRRKVLRILKWAGAAWCLILVVAWPVSVGRALGYRSSFGEFCFRTGTMDLDIGRPPTGRPGFVWESGYLFPEWFPGYQFAWNFTAHPAFLSVATWFVLLISAAFTGLLFRLDRKRTPPGHCQSCGYDLTGNVSGKCPECAAEVPGDIT